MDAAMELPTGPWFGPCATAVHRSLSAGAVSRPQVEVDIVFNLEAEMTPGRLNASIAKVGSTDPIAAVLNSVDVATFAVAATITTRDHVTFSAKVVLSSPQEPGAAGRALGRSRSRSSSQSGGWRRAHRSATRPWRSWPGTRRGK